MLPDRKDGRHQREGMANAEARSMQSPKEEVREGGVTIPKGWGVHD